MRPSTIQQAVILAAGRGTRLTPLTNDRPKSLLPILGKPILIHLIECLHQAGIGHFVIVAGHELSQVQAVASHALPPDLTVQWVVQPAPTGTVDALQRALPLLTGPFLLSAGDNLTSVEHVRTLIVRHQSAPNHIATLSLLRATPAEIRQSADVLVDGEEVLSIVEKPAQPQGQHAAFMLYALSPDLARYLPAVQPTARGERELVSALQLALAAGCRIGSVLATWRLHLTRPADLLHLNSWYLRQTGRVDVASDLPPSVRLIAPIRIDPGVCVGDHAVLGPYVYLEKGAQVGAQARLQHAVVLSGGDVPPSATLQYAVLDRHRCFFAQPSEETDSAHKE
ncbi:MAG: glucose-1-phosphate thymidylyltransferase [Anaerolineae bacterium]